MLIIISLAVAVTFSLALRTVLKKHPWPFYIAAIALSALFAAVDIPGLPVWIDRYVIDLFRRGTLGTALFVVVMYMVTFPNGSRPIRMLMPIRGELSILASILSLCHNVFFGRIYFVAMFTEPLNLPVQQRIAGVLSIILILIMVPLFVMSFPGVRRKMRPKKWKQIQRTAYIFYALLYAHVVILMFPSALRGMPDPAVSITAYTLLFGTYAILRLKKARFDQRIKLPFQILATIVSVCVLAACWTGYGAAVGKVDSAKAEGTAYADGVYRGSGMGYGGELVLEVEIFGGKMVAVRVLEHRETESFYARALANIDAMIERQSNDVEAVSGATMTCNAISEAVGRALEQAGAE